MKTSIEEKQEANRIFGAALKDLALDHQTYSKYLYAMLPKSELDLMFIVDCTGSMGSWITAVKNEIFSIVNQIKAQFKTSCIRLCFCGYRDIQDGKIRFSILPFTTNWREFKKFVSGVSAAGGGDAPEDVYGGLKHALEQKWASGARYAVFIADAPGHGKNYHDFGGGDSYPNGDPSGEDLEHFMKEFAEKKIKFYSARIDKCTDKMLKKLSDEYKKHSGREIEQGELGHSVKEFGNFIVKTALETLIKNQEEEGVKKIDVSSLYYQVVFQMKNNTQFSVSNQRFTQKHNAIIEMNKTLKEVESAKKDEDFEEHVFEVENTEKKGIKSLVSSLVKLFTHSTETESSIEATRHTFSVKKEEGYPTLIKWNRPLQIETTSSQVTIKLTNKPIAKGKTNYIFKLLSEHNGQRVGRIPIRVQRGQKADLDHYINLNKSTIIAQAIYQKEQYVDFCIYEVNMNNVKFFISSEPFQKDLTTYDKNASFLPLSYDSDGLYRQFVGHDSYQRTLGQYLVGNYSYKAGAPQEMYKPQVFSLHPQNIISHSNQGYIGIFKYFINHTCTEKCTQENNLIDLDDFTNPEKLNFRLPEPPAEEVQQN